MAWYRHHSGGTILTVITDRLVQSIQTFTLRDKVLLCRSLENWFSPVHPRPMNIQHFRNMWNHEDHQIWNSVRNFTWRSLYSALLEICTTFVMQFAPHVCCVTGLCMVWNPSFLQILHVLILMNILSNLVFQE